MVMAITYCPQVIELNITLSFSCSQIGFTSQKQWMKYVTKMFPDYVGYGVNGVGQPYYTSQGVN